MNWLERAEHFLLRVLEGFLCRWRELRFLRRLRSGLRQEAKAETRAASQKNGVTHTPGGRG